MKRNSNCCKVTAAVLFLLCSACAARAEFKYGGSVTLDMFYHFQDSNRVEFSLYKDAIIVDTLTRANQVYYANDTTRTSTVENDNLDLIFSIPLFYNRFWFDYSFDQFEAYIQLRAGSRKWAKIKKAKFIGETFNIAEAWFKWKPTPEWGLTLGRQTTGFSRLLPATRLGRDGRDSKDYNFGDMVAQHQLSAARLDYAILPNLGAGLFLIDPDADGSEIIQTFKGTSIQSTTETSLFPRVDMFLNYQIAPGLRLEPSFTWLYQRYDIGKGPESDTDFHIYGLALGAEAKAGFFTFAGEAHWGKNLGDGNYVGAEWEGTVEKYQAFFDTTNTGSPTNYRNKLSDAKIRSGWVNLGITFNAFDLNSQYGIYHAENEGIPPGVLDRNLEPFAGAEADQHSVTMWMAGLSLPIKIRKKLTITPEVMYYNFGGDYRNGTVNTVKYYSDPNDKNSASIRVPYPKEIDRGFEYVAGIQMRMVF